MTPDNPQISIMKPYTLTLRERLVVLNRPWVMGILNVTPDSFFASSRVMKPEEAVRRVRAMLQQGADIIDIGACSTRPGSQSVGAEEELQRLEEPLEAIRKAFPDAILSVDTFRASVAGECVRRWNVDIINDVSGASDPEMIPLVTRSKAAYVLMHTRGTPADMDSRCNYGEDVVADVVEDLAFRLDALHRGGACNVIVDPGFGFAKTTRQNLMILDRLEDFGVLGCPVLVGISRKRMAREAGECDLEEALTSTVALNTVALMKGASIIRVHDVREGALVAKTIGNLWSVSE